MVTYRLEDFSGKQTTRHRSVVIPYYPKELFVREQMWKYFSESSLYDSTHKNRLTRSQNLSRLIQLETVFPANKIEPSLQTCYTQSRLADTESEDYNTRKIRFRKQLTKEYRVFKPQSKFLFPRATHK